MIITRVTSPGTNSYPHQKFPVACDDLEKDFLDEGGSPNSQEKLEKPEKQDDGDYVYLLLKPPLRKEIAECKEEDGKYWGKVSWSSSGGGEGLTGGRGDDLTQSYKSYRPVKMSQLFIN